MEGCMEGGMEGWMEGGREDHAANAQGYSVQIQDPCQLAENYGLLSKTMNYSCTIYKLFLYNATVKCTSTQRTL